MRQDRYRFYFAANDDPLRLVKIDVTDQHVRSRTRDGEKPIFRLSMQQGFVLKPGSGYTRIVEGDREDQYQLVVNKLVNGQEREYYKGTFSYTDCDFDYDIPMLTVTPEVDDRYRLYLEQESTEYDLIELNTPVTPFSYQQYAILQVYEYFSAEVASITNGTVNIKQVERVGVNSDLQGVYGFSEPTELIYIPYRSDYPEDISGAYLPTAYDGAFPFAIEFRRVDGQYTYRVVPGFTNLYITNSAGVDVAISTLDDNGNGIVDPGEFDNRVFRFVADNSIVAYHRRAGVYSRFGLAIDMGWPASAETQLIDSGDQFLSSPAYDRTAKYRVNIEHSIQTSDTNLGYDKYAPDGTYPNAGKFIAPPRPASPGTVWVPVGRDKWVDTSFWYLWSFAESNLVQSYTKTVTVPDAYLLSDAMASVVTAIDDRITYGASIDHGLLLNADVNPVTGDPKRHLLIVSKSNLLVYNYDKPAGRAPVAMQDFNQLLRFMYQAESTIDNDFKLVTETIGFYESGNTYDEQDPRVGTDYTTLIEPKTKRPWAWRTSKLKFDKQKLPERIVFGWSDEVSDAFEGTDILMLSRYINRGQQEDRKVPRFTTDLQMAITSPGNFSTEGFFLVSCYVGPDGGYVVDSVDVPGYGNVQNGALAWPYLHPHYYRSVMPAERLQINGQEVTATSVKRTGEQEPFGAPMPFDADPFELVRTFIGAGSLRQANENMATEVSQIQLAHGIN